MNFIEKIVLSIRTIRNLPVLFLNYAGVLHDDILYTTTNGLKFIARSNTPDVAEIIIVNSGRNYPFSKIPVAPNPIIIDLGGGIGDFSLYSRFHFRKTKPKIYTFEPDKENFSYLQKNIFINEANDTIIPFNEAVFSTNGTAYLDVHDKSSNQYMVSKKKMPNSLLCRTITLTNIFKKMKISQAYILKMDIEGSEYELLSDRKTLLLINNKVTYILIEYHDHSQFDYHWIIQQLSNFKLLYNDNFVLLLQNEHYKKR